MILLKYYWQNSFGKSKYFSVTVLILYLFLLLVGNTVLKVLDRSPL